MNGECSHTVIKGTITLFPSRNKKEVIFGLNSNSYLKSVYLFICRQKERVIDAINVFWNWKVENIP